MFPFLQMKIFWVIRIKILFDQQIGENFQNLISSIVIPQTESLSFSFG